MSVNAGRARDEGKRPGADMAKYLRRWFPSITPADVRAVLVPCEWHHTSKRFNTTDFFDPRDLIEQDTRRAMARQIRARKLFARLFSAHAIDGLIMLRIETGQDWHTVKSGDLRYLGRLLASLAGGCPADYTAGENRQRQLLAEHGLDGWKICLFNTPYG
jgi:hypothetical protein